MPKPTVTLQEYQERKAKAIERRKGGILYKCS